jgi:hypothetical protein
MIVRSIKIRLFITCWLIFVLHFATDFVREHYLVLSIVEDFSFRLDKYADLHDDMFETKNHGVHHGANPGASMIATVPYFVFKPMVNVIVNYYSSGRKDISEGSPGVYQDSRPDRVKFFNKVRERGLDIKFGLVGFISMVFCMALLSAWGAVVMYQALFRLRISQRLSIWMSLLFAFGTPIFFRTGYLNQNLMVGIFGFIAFVKLWQMESRARIWQPLAFSGFLGGLAVLCDYSGLIPLFMLYGYGLVRRMDSVSFWQAVRESLWYIGGAIGPIALLWFYQWQSFGHPLYPGQHYMHRVDWIDVGYRGFGGFSGELLGTLLFDHRFGLFVVAPILLLAFLSPILSVLKKNVIPLRETIFILGFFVAFTLFFGNVQYTRLQWVTGIRYMVPVIPFLFLLTGAVLIRMPRILFYSLSILAFAESWAMSIVRSVGVPEAGVIDSIHRVFAGEIQLPWLTTLSKMTPNYIPLLGKHGLSPLPFFVLCGLIIYGIWRVRFPGESLKKEG